MDELFPEGREGPDATAPLAARMRPRSLDELVGQTHVLGQDSALRSEIERDGVTSVILYGPPGTGKTSLAHVIALESDAAFEEVSAVSSGVKEIREAIGRARDRRRIGGPKTILFVDEIHRFNRSQQDALLHAVEDGEIVLVGATTENPFFEVNAPLISRSRVVELRPLSDEDVRTILRAGAADAGRGLGGVELTEEAEGALVTYASGDARVALQALESAASLEDADRVVREQDVRAAMHARPLPYDKAGDVHYDVVSAFIKSMRGCDPDAAVYWLARMIHGGEDPRFIARRMLIFAAEDVGNAEPQAVCVAHAAVKAAEFIGWPECRINLAQAAIFLALAPKSNAAISAVDSALREVREGPGRAVPAHLRDASYPGAKEMGRGVGYRYPHADPDAWAQQRHLPDGLEDAVFYRPSDRGWEAARDAELHASQCSEDREDDA